MSAEVNKPFAVTFMNVEDKSYLRLNVEAYHRVAAEMFGWKALAEYLGTGRRVGWMLIRCAERKEPSEDHPS